MKLSELRLFEALASGPATLEELAKRVAAPVRTVGIVAAAMVSLRLIEQQGIRYNSAAAAAFLGGKRGHDLRPMLRYFNGISDPQWRPHRQGPTTDSASLTRHSSKVLALARPWK